MRFVFGSYDDEMNRDYNILTDIIGVDNRIVDFATDVYGWNDETMCNVLWWVTGYRDFDQLYGSEFEDEVREYDESNGYLVEEDDDEDEKEEEEEEEEEEEDEENDYDDGDEINFEQYEEPLEI